MTFSSWLSAAFDTVDHNALFVRLSTLFNIHGTFNTTGI